MTEIFMDLMFLFFLLSTIFTLIGLYMKLEKGFSNPYLPLGIGIFLLSFSLYSLAIAFDSRHILNHDGYEIPKTSDSIINASIFFVISLIPFYMASKYNNALLQNIHIFIRWLGKKTVPSIFTTIIVAWLCHRLGFEIPAISIVSITFAGITFALNANLSKNT